MTNGSVWQVYHLTGGLPVGMDLALEVNLLGAEPPAHKVNQLFFLSRESLKKRQIDELVKVRTGKGTETATNLYQESPGTCGITTRIPPTSAMQRER